MSRAVRSVAMAFALVLFGGSAAQATVGPYYTVHTTWSDTVLAPEAEGVVTLQVRNVGDAGSSEALTITDRLPTGVVASGVNFAVWVGLSSGGDRAKLYCSDWDALTEKWVPSETVTCTIPGKDLPELIEAPGELASSWNPEPSGYLPALDIDVKAPAGASGTGANTATVSGGGAAAPFSDTRLVSFGTTPVGFGVVPESFGADVFNGPYALGQPSRQAGEHPFEQRVSFDVNSHMILTPENLLGSSPNGLVKTVEVGLPRGVIVNPQALPECPATAFAEEGASSNATTCPPDTQIGYLNVSLAVHASGGAARNSLLSRVPIYNLAPPKGKLADFGFVAGGFVQGHIYGELDPSRNYALKAIVPDIGALIPVLGSETTLWGVPGDPAHNWARFYSEKQSNGDIAGAPFEGAAIRPLITNAMDCGVENGGTLIRVESYGEPGVFTPAQEYANHDDVTGCEDPRFRFEPDITLEPSDRYAGAPTGLEVKLKVPQRKDEVKNASELYAQSGSVQAIATPPIKKTVVTLPEGMTLNPSAGQGLEGCSLAQLGMSPSGVPNGEPVRCPAGSQIGTLIMHSPDLPENEPLEGRVYVSRQGENPFGSLFALYLVLERAERDLLVKLAGKIELDPVTGQIKTTFDDLPQFPVSDFQLKFKGGIRAALVNPSTCGRKTITAEYFSWQDPSTPHVATSLYEITQRPDGSPCLNSLNERSFSPQLTAGTLNPTGGAFSPFELHLTRTDEDQEISSLSVTLPNGLLAKLTGVAQCPEASIAQAENAGRTGTEEQANPSCPSSSQIGSVLVGTGTGASLAWVPGKVYFAGPYKGAPFSLVVITPAVVGPYDLGVTVVRSALYIDPHTAQATVVSDPFPQILKGIPVRIRDVRVTIDRPQFMFNPSNCSEERISGSSTSAFGVSASMTNRFQVANCASLAFKPKFTASTSGKPSRRAGASLDVRVAYPKAPWGSQANIRSVKVNLPRQLPSRLETLQQGCLDKVFNENPAACPVASRVGMAIVHTPVLPVPLTGPAYFVSHGAREFPDLIIVLQGDGVTVDLRGQTHISKKGITSSIYRSVPDVPFETFELKLPQGPYSALASHGNPCKAKGGLKMPTLLTAQNGMQIKQETKIKVVGCPSRARGKRHNRHGRRKKR